MTKTLALLICALLATACSKSKDESKPASAKSADPAAGEAVRKSADDGVDSLRQAQEAAEKAKAAGNAAVEAAMKGEAAATAAADMAVKEATKATAKAMQLEKESE